MKIKYHIIFIYFLLILSCDKKGSLELMSDDFLGILGRNNFFICEKKEDIWILKDYKSRNELYRMKEEPYNISRINNDEYLIDDINSYIYWIKDGELTNKNSGSIIITNKKNVILEKSILTETEIISKFISFPSEKEIVGYDYITGIMINNEKYLLLTDKGNAVLFDLELNKMEDYGIFYLFDQGTGIYEINYLEDGIIIEDLNVYIKHSNAFILTSIAFLDKEYFITISIEEKLFLYDNTGKLYQELPFDINSHYELIIDSGVVKIGFRSKNSRSDTPYIIDGEESNIVETFFLRDEYYIRLLKYSENEYELQNDTACFKASEYPISIGESMYLKLDYSIPIFKVIQGDKTYFIDSQLKPLYSTKLEVIDFEISRDAMLLHLKSKKNQYLELVNFNNTGS